MGLEPIPKLVSTFERRDIIFDDDCAEAPSLAEEFKGGVVEEAKFGMKTGQDVEEAQLQEALIKALCL